MKEKKNSSFYLKGLDQFFKPFLLLVILFSISQAQSQTSSYPDYSYKPDKGYFKSYWTVTKKIPTGPARWKAGEWVAFTGVVIGGIIVYNFDDEIRKWIQRNPTHTKDNIAKYGFEPMGGGIFQAVLLGGFYVYGLAAKKSLPRKVALAGVQTFIMTVITTEVIKNIAHRHRPNQDEIPNPRLWEGPFKGWEYDAFPSLHTSSSFAFASLISSVYKDKIWVAILSYGLATGVAWSRVYENEHWPSDVLIGAALGFAIGKTVYHVMQGKTNLSLGFSDTGGVALVYHLK